MKENIVAEYTATGRHYDKGARLYGDDLSHLHYNISTDSTFDRNDLCVKCK